MLRRREEKEGEKKEDVPSTMLHKEEEQYLELQWLQSRYK